MATYGLIFVWLWGNWRVPGLQIAAVGIALNTLAVVLNGGQMPIWAAAFNAAGFTPDALANDPFHFLLTTSSVADFVKQGGIFGDVLPIPIPVIRDVVSIGDTLLAVGIFWAIVYSMTRPNAPMRAAYTLGLRPGDPFANASPFPGGQAQSVGSMPALAAAAARVARRSRFRRSGRSPRTWPSFATATSACCGWGSWSASSATACTRSRWACWSSSGPRRSTWGSSSPRPPCRTSSSVRWPAPWSTAGTAARP